MALIDLSRERELRNCAREARGLDDEVKRLLLCQDSAAAEQFASSLVRRANVGLGGQAQASIEVQAARAQLTERRIAAARFLQLALVD